MKDMECEIPTRQLDTARQKKTGWRVNCQAVTPATEKNPVKNNILKLLASSAAILILGLSGCGGGGGSDVAPAEIPGLVTAVGWYYVNKPPDYSSSGATCDLRPFVYYSTTLTTDDIDTFTLIAANGQHWTATTSKQFGTGSNNSQYISGEFHYGSSPATFPLAGTWTVQLKLKDGHTSTFQKTFHEPGSSAESTHSYVYSPEDYTPTDSSLFVPALRRFPSGGYSISYSSADNKILSTGLAAVRSGYLAAEPRAFNMSCWLYDTDKTYLGYTNYEYTTVDHSSSGLIANGELSIVPAETFASTGNVDLLRVKYIRFVYADGAQYAPTSYASYDYRAISPLIPVN